MVFSNIFGCFFIHLFEHSKIPLRKPPKLNQPNLQLNIKRVLHHHWILLDPIWILLNLQKPIKSCENPSKITHGSQIRWTHHVWAQASNPWVPAWPFPSSFAPNWPGTAIGRRRSFPREIHEKCQEIHERCGDQLPNARKNHDDCFFFMGF